jgi:hypothetical protein
MLAASLRSNREVDFLVPRIACQKFFTSTHPHSTTAFSSIDSSATSSSSSWFPKSARQLRRHRADFPSRRFIFNMAHHIQLCQACNSVRHVGTISLYSGGIVSKASTCCIAVCIQLRRIAIYNTYTGKFVFTFRIWFPLHFHLRAHSCAVRRNVQRTADRAARVTDLLYVSNLRQRLRPSRLHAS